MQNNVKSILDLESDEAMEYMMSEGQYYNFELPEYIKFESILKHVASSVGSRSYAECCAGDASQQKGINLTMLTNKDGGYGVRPLTITNPYMYYFLCRELFGKENWAIVRRHFDACTVPSIHSYAMPIVPDSAKPESFHKASTILNWWRNTEQQSIELSMQYRYMFVSDISNCYGTIRHDSIVWALTRKGTARQSDEGEKVAMSVKNLLHDMQQGSTIGIPQGSVAYDMVAEIVLAYADLLLSEKLEAKGIDNKDYTILRYRDDYKVFCNSKSLLEEISYMLQEVLESLNLRMNTSKTKISTSIITDSIKPDKLNYIFGTPISGNDWGKKWYAFGGLQKHLLYILLFARQNPNSGQIKNLLSQFSERIDKRMKDAEEPKAKPEHEGKTVSGESIEKPATDQKPIVQKGKLDGVPKGFKPGPNDVSLGIEWGKDDEDAGKDKGTSTEETKKPSIFDQIANRKSKKNDIRKRAWRLIAPHGIEGSIRAHCAIALQIGMENIGAVHYALRVISSLLKAVDDKKERDEIARLVSNRLRTLPNSDYTQIWLQQMTLIDDEKGDENPYDATFCQTIFDICRKKKATLWNNDWLKKTITKGLPIDEIIDQKIKEEAGIVITFREKRAYDEWIDFPDNIEELLEAMEKQEEERIERERNLKEFPDSIEEVLEVTDKQHDDSNVIFRL